MTENEFKKTRPRRNNDIEKSDRLKIDNRKSKDKEQIRYPSRVPVHFSIKRWSKSEKFDQKVIRKCDQKVIRKCDQKMIKNLIKKWSKIWSKIDPKIDPKMMSKSDPKMMSKWCPNRVKIVSKSDKNRGPWILEKNVTKKSGSGSKSVKNGVQNVSKPHTTQNLRGYL